MVLDKLKSILSGDEGRSSTTPYRCSDCGHEFESTTDHPKDAECPECGGTRISTRMG